MLSNDPANVHPFERLQTKSQESLRRLSALQYEERLVRFVVTQLKLGTAAMKQLSARRRNLDGSGYLLLADFNELFPDFPIVLGADRLEGIRLHLEPRAFLPSLFKAFDKAPFVAAYEAFWAAAASRAQGRALGLIFPRKGFRHGLIIHNGGLDEYWIRGMVMVYQGGTEQKQERLYVQSFAPLVESIREHGWRV